VSLREADFRRILSVIDELGTVPDPETFRERTVRLVHGLVPADSVGFSESDPAKWVELTGTAWPNSPWTDEMETVYWTFAYQNPLGDAFAHNGAAHLRRMSDVIDRRSLDRLDFYQESLHPFGVEYDLMMQLPWEVGWCRSVELTRSDSDFTDRDVEVLAVLQPHLIRGYSDSQDRQRLREAVTAFDDAGDGVEIGLATVRSGGRVIEATERARAYLERFFGESGTGLPEDLNRWIVGEHRRTDGDVHERPRRPFLAQRSGRRLRVRLVSSPWGDHLLFDEQRDALRRPNPRLGLTSREVDVLLLVSQGLTNKEAARRLSVTSNTVRKHLENAYAKLGVGTRTAAVAKAFGGRSANSTSADDPRTGRPGS